MEFLIALIILLFYGTIYSSENVLFCGPFKILQDIISPFFASLYHFYLMVFIIFYLKTSTFLYHRQPLNTVLFKNTL